MSYVWKWLPSMPPPFCRPELSPIAKAAAREAERFSLPEAQEENRAVLHRLVLPQSLPFTRSSLFLKTAVKHSQVITEKSFKNLGTVRRSWIITLNLRTDTKFPSSNFSLGLLVTTVIPNCHRLLKKKKDRGGFGTKMTPLSFSYAVGIQECFEAV